MAAEKKKKPDHVRRIEKSRELLMFWYSNRCDDSTQRYHPDGSELTIAAPALEFERQGIRTVDGKLTADGRETRAIDPQILGSFPTGWATDPLATFGPHGSHHQKRRERHAKDCLQHVYAVNPDLHRALEMHAAGWKLDAIASELNKSVHKARSHIERGLDVISSYRILVKA